MLKDEFHYYIEHRDELVRTYNGKFVVIKDQRVLDAYDTELEAIQETSSKHELGTFLVQLCSTDPNATLQTYHSRAVFAEEETIVLV